MADKEYKKLRIFVASPGDVAAERQRVHLVADELNRTGNLADSLGITLEVLDWSTHVTPFMGRPQKVVLDQLPVKNWDIFIGILWLRFGTASAAKNPKTGKEFDSGTEEEFTLAYDFWKKSGRPKISFYRCTRSPEDIVSLDPEQLGKVQQFFQKFDAKKQFPGIFQTYKTPDDFERHVRQGLNKILLADGEKVLKRKDTPSKKAKEVIIAAQTADIKEKYLDFVYSEHGHIRLFGFLSGANIDVSTIDVFVSLRFSDPGREMHLRGISAVKKEQKPATPASVLEKATAQKKPLLILGGPGFGKTTLLKYFSVCCRTLEGRSRIFLQKPLIPFLIPLRQFDASKPFAKALAAWARDNKQAIPETVIKQWLQEPGALVLLDGLDEVSDLETRKKICRMIDKAVADFEKSTFVVTCRFTGYNELKQHALKSDPLQYDVLELDDAQQETFFRQWFETAALTRLEPHESGNEQIKEIKDKAAGDARAVMKHLAKEENKSLHDLATVPVLLQIMAIIWREQGNISGERAELYKRSIDYLLDYRDQHKGIPRVLTASKARLVLRPLALWMQEIHKKDEAPGEEIEQQIAQKLQEVKPGLDPRVFLENIRDRAGVLVGSGAETYTFQHKSFREFLAAIEIANQNKVSLLVDNFDEPWWRETLLFSAAVDSPLIFPDFLKTFLRDKKNSGPTAPLLLQLMQEAAVKPLHPFKEVVLNRKLNWQMRFNALKCLRFIKSDETIALLKSTLDDRDRNVRELAREILSDWQIAEPLEIRVTEEIKVGEKIKRFRNPIERNAEYILIRGGKYEYSVDKNQTEVPDIYFAKYPITNKFYRSFIDYLAGWGKQLGDAHLPKEKFVKSLLKKTEEIEGFVKYLGTNANSWKKKLRSSYDQEKRFYGSDQPVVGVTWYAATAYCHWVSEMYQAVMAARGTSEPEKIFRLPTEQEWEWAAGGGKQLYPWGKQEPDKTRANFGQEVGHTTPVGSYPEGATPDGLMDVAGNVWEWMENLYDDKDYRDARALRGGSWSSGAGDLPCSARNGISPVNSWNFNGFRVVCVQS